VKRKAKSKLIAIGGENKYGEISSMRPGEESVMAAAKSARIQKPASGAAAAKGMRRHEKQWLAARHRRQSGIEKRRQWHGVAGGGEISGAINNGR